MTIQFSTDSLFFFITNESQRCRPSKVQLVCLCYFSLQKSCLTQIWKDLHHYYRFLAAQPRPNGPVCTSILLSIRKLMQVIYFTHAIFSFLCLMSILSISLWLSCSWEAGVKTLKTSDLIPTELLHTVSASRLELGPGKSLFITYFVLTVFRFLEEEV